MILDSYKHFLKVHNCAHHNEGGKQKSISIWNEKRKNIHD